MFKLSYQELNRESLIQSLSTLSREKLPVKVSWNIQRIMRQLEKEIKEGGEIYTKLLKDTCEVDEHGNLAFERTPDIQQEDGTIIPGHPIPGKFMVKDEEEFKKRHDEFMNLEVEIQSYPITLGDLERIEVTPSTMLGLAPIVQELALAE